MLNLILMALLYMRQRKVRTLFAIVAILFGVAVIFAAWTAIPVLRETKLASITAASTDTPEAVEQGLSLITAVLNSFGLIALFVGGFLIFNTCRAIIVERQRDLATLRMIGADQGQVLQVLLTEAALQGVIGTGLGLLCGWALALWMIQFTVQTGYLPAGAVLGWPGMGGALFASGFGMGTALVAAFFPARRAGRLSPLAALRPPLAETEQQTSRRGLWAGLACFALAAVLLTGTNAALAGLVALVGAILLMPVWISLFVRWAQPVMRRFFPDSADVACGNVLRQRGRSAVTASALMVGFAVFIGCMTMLNSLRVYTTRLISFHLASDYVVVNRASTLSMVTGNLGALTPLDSAVTDSIRNLPEIDSSMGLRIGSIEYQGRSLRMVGIDPDYAAELRPIDLVSPADSAEAALQALAEQRAVLVSSQFAEDTGITPGDTLNLMTAAGTTQPYQVAGVVVDLLIGQDNWGVVLGQQYLAQDFGIDEDTALYLNMRDDAADQLRALLPANLLLLDVGALRDQEIQTAINGLSVIYAFAALVIFPALLGLANTAAINVLERTHELGILRAIGGEAGHIQRILLIETLVLGIAGVILGVGVGVVFGASLTTMMSSNVNANAVTGGLHFQLPWAGMVAALITGLGVMLLVTLAPARRAAHMRIVDALRYE